MLLTAEMFTQIIQSLRSDGLHNGTREQRKMPRVGVRGRTSIMIPDKTGTKVFNANVRDISSAGIGLQLSEPLLSKGEEFLLVLSAGSQSGSSGMLCVVRRTARLADNIYTIGAGFIKETNPADVISDVIARNMASQLSAKPSKPVVQAPPKPVEAAARVEAPHRPETPPRPYPASMAHALGDEILAGADKKVVGDLESRLKALSA